MEKFVMDSNVSNPKSSLKDRVLADRNIFNAIHALKSYVFDENLLSGSDLKLYIALQDEFNDVQVRKMIKKCRNRLIDILEKSDVLFTVKVYFKLKKYDEKKDIISFRPVHTASLIDLICMTCLLQVIMFEDDLCREKSDLTKKIPDVFYGNRPSLSVDRIFEVWQDMYAKYSHEVVLKSKRYRSSHEYKTEVTLDIQNFFPSISPKFIIEYCFDALSGRCFGDDLKILKVIIEKLVYLKLDKRNIEGWIKEYYDKNDLGSPFYLVKGVAQGLPQSYFFGNLCMVEIRRILNQIDLFEGDAVFYVDDSVIYIKSDVEKDDFISNIKALNSKIESFFDDGAFKFLNGSEDSIVVQYESFHGNLEYKIKFHDDSKSSFCHIDDTVRNLAGLPKTVSGGGYYILMDEIDQNVELDRLRALECYVDNYIHYLKDETGDIKDLDGKKPNLCNIKNTSDKSKSESDLKILHRYKKLFLYAIKVLKFKKEGGLEYTGDGDFNQDFDINGNPDETAKKRWFDNDDGSRFKAMCRLMIRNLSFCEAQKFLDRAIGIEFKLSGKDVDASKWLYHRKDFKGILSLKSVSADRYKSLKTFMNLYFKDRVQAPMGKRIEQLKTFMTELDKKCLLDKKYNEENSGDNLLPFVHEEWMGFALSNSANLKRMLLNAFFSFISEFDISDNIVPVKAFGKPISYSELRILVRLRNRNFDYDEFRSYIYRIDIGCLENKMHIDYGIIKILDDVVRYVSDPELVDNVIVTHRITKGLWQNGSKFLNSYTLHNEDHAVSLVKKAIDLVNKINYLSIKKFDYYILFVACYLHDISMVIHPNLHQINKDCNEAKLLVSECLKTIDVIYNEINSGNIDKKNRKRRNIYKDTGNYMRRIFQDVYDYFENDIRNNHATDSARFIVEKKSIFSYLSPSDISLIAKVGESHGYDISEVYGLKSRAAVDSVSEKYIMMLLRLADLHDVANDRINYHLLRQNVEHMNPSSRFHWISHLVTDSIRLIPRYKVCFDEIMVDGHLRFNQYILEILSFELMLNVKCLAPLKQDADFKRCEGVCDLDLIVNNDVESNDGYDCLSVNIGSGACVRDRCPTICRWTMKKHEWLVKELQALRLYLNHVNDSMIRTRIELNIKFKNELNLEQDLYDDVIKYIDSNC